MKNIFLLLLASVISLHSFAQEEEPEKEEEKEESRGFKKNRLFTGGSVGLGFGSGSTSIGLIPHFGYSINKYIDVALSFNFNYISQRDIVEYGDKARQTIFGPGAFVRIFPVKFLFAQAQFEHNFIKIKYHPATNGSYLPSTQRFGANSILVGAGYAQGREDSNTFYYMSLMFDVGNSKDSPYKDNLGRVNPIIKAGVNVALFQGGKFYDQ